MRLVYVTAFLGLLFFMGEAFAQEPAANHPDRAVAQLPGPELLAGARDTITVAVAPGKEVFLTGFTEYVPSTCAAISSGMWTETSQPASGTVRIGTLTGAFIPACPGMTFTFAVIYYTLNQSSTSKMDTFSAIWSTQDGMFSNPETFNLDVPTLNFTFEDVSQDKIIIDAEPSGLSGNLVINAFGDKKTPTIVNQSLASGSPVTLAYGETTKPLPAQHYNTLKATWTVNGVAFRAQRAVNFTALGLFQNTQYNIPHESSCTADPGAVTLWTSACVSSDGSYKTDFTDKVNLNGTGVPSAGGYTAPEGFCTHNVPRVNFRYPFAIRDFCGNNNLTNQTIAVDFNTSTLFSCGQRVFFVGENPSGGLIGSLKTITDRCPGCGTASAGTAGHVDNFTTAPDCSGVASLPNYQAIILGK